MNSLIEELKNEHKEIIAIFDKIEQVENFHDKKELIQELIALIVPHLKKEDELIHPIIVKSADEEVCRAGRILSKVTQEISQEFGLVADEMLKVDNFTDAKTLDDFEKICDKIKTRIALEESVMFPAYEECV